MPIDVEGAELEGFLWKPTGEMRWYRPKHADDTQLQLQVLWERATGEREWRPVPTFLED
jgi:hypothetical protein